MKKKATKNRSILKEVLLAVQQPSLPNKIRKKFPEKLQVLIQHTSKQVGELIKLVALNILMMATRNPVNSPVEVGSLSHCGFIHPRWCRISSILPFFQYHPRKMCHKNFQPGTLSTGCQAPPHPGQKWPDEKHKVTTQTNHQL